MTSAKRSLLIVDDEPYILRTLVLHVAPHYDSNRHRFLGTPTGDGCVNGFW